MVTAWCKQYSKLPVIVKLTPNITDIRNPARAAKRGGADAVSLINTINSIMGVDPYTLTMSPSTGGKGSHGGYCGPAVKPIALNMVAEIARDPETAGLPISSGLRLGQERRDQDQQRADPKQPGGGAFHGQSVTRRKGRTGRMERGEVPED